MSNEIGKYIKKLREEKNITQNQLAERLNITSQAVSKWERGENLPDTGLLIDLSRILQTTVDSILLAGNKVLKYRNRVSVKEVKSLFDTLCEMKNTIGKDNSVYVGIINGINSEMNVDIEKILENSYETEAMIAEIIVQNIIKGSYVDLTEVKEVFNHDKWFEIVKEYAKRYDLK